MADNPGTYRRRLARPDVLSATESLEIRAVPGAGKTSLVCSKIAGLLSDSAPTARCVLALTYTRAAVQEIKARLARQLSPEQLQKAHVATFHGFTLARVIQPNAALAPELPQPITFVTQESPEFVEAATQVEKRSKFKLDDYAYARRRRNGTPERSNKLSAEKAIAFWKLLEGQGLLDTPSLFYYAARILRSDRAVARAVSARYRAIIVDEYQDTSQAQLAVLKELAKSKRSQLILVGDPNQTLYEFTGVSNEALEAFAKDFTRASADLNECYRCAMAVCIDAQALIERVPPIVCASDLNGRVRYKEVRSVVRYIAERFVPGLTQLNIPLKSAAVLLPTNPSKGLILKLRSLGVPCSGDKTRLYTKTIVSVFVEAALALATCPDSESMEASRSSLADILGTGSYIHASDTQSHAHAVWLQELVRKLDLRDSPIDCVKNIFSFLKESAYQICDPARFEALRPQVRQLIRELKGQSVSIDDLAETAVTRHSLNILTINGSKGREFRAVAVLELDNGLLPHAKSKNEAEGHRKLYVAVTRAREYLTYGSSPGAKSTYLMEIEARRGSIKVERLAQE